MRDTAGNAAADLDEEAVENRTTDATPGDLRLVDGTADNEGRLEIFAHGLDADPSTATWGTVCDDGFEAGDNHAAAVACRILGHADGELADGYGQPGVGLGEQRIWLDDVRCLADEAGHRVDDPGSLFDCNHAGVGLHNCSHEEDVGLRCSGTERAEPTAGRGPVPLSATVDGHGRGVVVRFDEALKADALPPPETFGVTEVSEGGGQRLPVLAVVAPGTDGLADDELRLIRDRPAMRRGNAVSVAYRDPTDGDDTLAVQDAAGNDADGFHIPAAFGPDDGTARPDRGSAVTAAFENVPTTHDGTGCEVDVRFAPPIEAPFWAVRDALDVYFPLLDSDDEASGGGIGAVRAVSGDAGAWRAEVLPRTTFDGDVLIRRDLWVRLSASPPCGTFGALCTAGDRRVREGVEKKVRWVGVGSASEVPAALTVAYETAPPATHDDATAFTFRIAFSEALDPAFADASLRDHLFSVWQSGTPGRLIGVTSVTAAGSGKRVWDVTVTPAGDGDISIDLGPGPQDCTEAHAACTTDGRALHGILPPRRVTGPANLPTLSVADAAAGEGTSAAFAVTLDRAAVAAVTVAYATASGTAVEDTDYTGASGTLTFAAGETAQTVTVALLQDDADESDETFALTLSSPTGAQLGDAEATGTIADDDDDPTVRFTSAPAEHDGTATIHAGLLFSEAIDDLGYRWVRDTLVTATNGTVAKAKRAAKPSNVGWNLEVAPSSSSDVTLSLTAGLTLPDNRTLEVGQSVTVRGPGPVGTSVDGMAVTLVWATPRDAFGSPSGPDYAVRVNGVPRAVATASLSGRTAVLDLVSPVAPDDAVTVGYVGSAMHPLADASGVLRSAPWYGVAVANVTGTDAPVPAVADAPLRPADPVAAAADDAVRLDASGLGLAEPSALVRLAALARLDLSDNALADIGVLAQFGGLRELDLSGNRIADLGPLAGLYGLERLDVSHNLVADLAPLAGLPHLRVLLLDGNAVTDLGPLTHLAKLEHLGLADNRVVDVSALQDLQRLRRLDLDGNRVADLSPLGDVGSLVWLALPGDVVSAADALGRLTGLRWVWFAEPSAAAGDAAER